MIYLNNTATSFPKPISVLNAINDYLSNPPANIGRNTMTSSFINDSRKMILDFFGDKENYNLIFTSGSTESINMALFGIDLNNKEVIISSSEHNSIIRPLMELKNNGKIILKIAQCDNDGFLEIDKFSDLISENTALVVINYVSNVTGNIQNIQDISKLIEGKNIKLLVDGSQAAGNIPINLTNFNPDFFAFTSHKSLFGLQGSGGLIVKKGINLKPFKYGGTGFKSTMLTQPEEFPHKYESGTQNVPGIISLIKGIEFIIETGLDNIILHKQHLMKTLINELEPIENISLYFDKNNYSWSVLSFNIKSVAPEEVAYILSSGYNIEIRAGIHCAPLIHHNLGTYPNGTIRVSPSYFTKESEISIFVDTIKKIAKEFK